MLSLATAQLGWYFMAGGEQKNKLEFYQVFRLIHTLARAFFVLLKGINQSYIAGVSYIHTHSLHPPVHSIRSCLLICIEMHFVVVLVIHPGCSYIHDIQCKLHNKIIQMERETEKDRYSRANNVFSPMQLLLMYAR